MRTKARMILVGTLIFAVATLMVLISWGASAEEPGTQTVGAWYGLVSFTIPGVGSGTFPFLAHFNRDGTWASDDARALGAIPPFQQASMLTGQWVRAGDHKVSWRGIEILRSSMPLPIGPNASATWFLLVGQGSHEIAPGDPNHIINGTGSTTLYACPPSATATGFTCPTFDEIESGAAPALPGFPPFTFEFTRVRPD